MNDNLVEGASQTFLPFFRWAIPILWAVVILSVVFAGMIFVVPLDDYRLFGNIIEVTVAIFCMACCLYAYRTASNRILLLLAAFAFFSYAISTIFWYLYSVALGRHFVFTTVSELGFLCFFLIFIAGISLEFPDEGMRFSTALTLLLFFLTVPIVAIGVSGDSQPVRLALLFVSFIVIEQLVATSIRFGIFRHPILWTGICLYCLGWMIYCIRESIFTVYTVPLFPAISPSVLTVYDLLSLIGPIIIGSMALIQIGLFSYLTRSAGTMDNR